MSKIKMTLVDTVESIYDSFVETNKTTVVNHNLCLLNLFSSLTQYMDSKHSFEFDCSVKHRETDNAIYIYRVKVYRVGTWLDRIFKKL